MQLHPYLIPLSFLMCMSVHAVIEPPLNLGTQSLSFLLVLANYMDKLKLKLICIDFFCFDFFLDVNIEIKECYSPFVCG